jgi:hypothetical protein
MTFDLFLLLHDKIGNLIEFCAKQHIYLGRKKKRSGRQVDKSDAESSPPHHQMDLSCLAQGLAALYVILLVVIPRTSWLITALVTLMY